MALTEQEELNMKNAMRGKLSDNYDDLEKVLENLSTKMKNTSDHGTYKFIEKAIQKIDSKMRTLKA